MGKRVGILALQGAVLEHARMVEAIGGATVHLIKGREGLAKIDGLILPGGESTTIGRLLEAFEMVEPIINNAKAGMPIWGTCAGMILMAKRIINQEKVHLSLMDISVVRNGYGGQLDSFSTRMSIPDVSKNKVPLVFIRAPYVQSIGPGVRVLAEMDKKIIAVEEDNLLATAFHPELTADLCIHRYFLRKL